MHQRAGVCCGDDTVGDDPVAVLGQFLDADLDVGEAAGVEGDRACETLPALWRARVARCDRTRRLLRTRRDRRCHRIVAADPYPASTLMHRGLDCRLLGAGTLAESLFKAVQETNPAAVIVVSHLSVARRSAIEALRLAQLNDTALFYAGNAFLSPQSRRGVPGTYLGNNLSQAADIITGTITSASASDPQGVRRRLGRAPAASRGDVA